MCCANVLRLPRTADAFPQCAPCTLSTLTGYLCVLDHIDSFGESGGWTRCGRDAAARQAANRADRAEAKPCEPGRTAEYCRATGVNHMRARTKI
eukprot:2751197-Pyramimonas_sp.AAC.1